MQNIAHPFFVLINSLINTFITTVVFLTLQMVSKKKYFNAAKEFLIENFAKGNYHTFTPHYL